jgi:hypothetical protein
MDQIILRVGDELVEPGLFAHKMLYVGPIGPNGEDVLNPVKGLPARFVHFCLIPNWHRLRVGQRGPEFWPEQMLVQSRAHEVVANAVVNRTFGPNCEHICSYVRTAKAESPQLQVAGGVGVLALLLLGLRSWGAFRS